MGKLFKIIFSIFATVILLVIIILGSLPFIIDPNDFKPEIEKIVNNKTGRVLTIPGHIKLTVFPWMGVSTGRLVLSNASGFSNQPFVEIEESDIKVKVLPLLSRQVEISQIILKGLKLNLEKNSHGVTNWDDLSESEKEGADIGMPVLAAFAIGGISLEDSQLSWDDRQTGKQIEIRPLNLKTERFEFNQPIAIQLDLTLINDEPVITETVSMKTDMVINEQLDRISFDDMKLELVTTGESVPGEKVSVNVVADTMLNLEENQVDTEIQLSTGDMRVIAQITGTGLDQSPDFTGQVSIDEFNPRQWMEDLDIQTPQMQDAEALSLFSMQFDLQASPESAKFSNIRARLDDSALTGSAEVKNYSQPGIGFNLSIDKINADGYMPSESTRQKMRSESSIPKGVSPAKAVVAGASLFPVEFLKQLKVKGRLSIGQVILKKLKYKAVHLTLNADNGDLISRQTVNQLYQGTYSGDVSINVQGKEPVLSLNEQLNHVELEPLLQDLNGEARMTGKANVSSTLHSRGHDQSDLIDSLNGKMNFMFTDGIIKGFNLQKVIDNGKSILKGGTGALTNKNDQTAYSEISATAIITNGLVRNDDLFARSSILRVMGKGTADLRNEQLDYKITAKAIRKEATQTEPEKIEGIPVIIDVGGTISKPSYVLNLNEMIPEKKREKLYKKIDKKLGPGVSDLLKQFLK